MKLRSTLLSFLLSFTVYFPGFTQLPDSALFKAGDKVNFIGNSITHSGGFHNHVLLYYVTRFPEAKVTFLNSGVSGDNANDMLRRVNEDIAPREADWSVIMAGMNDVNRALYAPDRQSEAGLEDKKKEAIQNYRNHMDKLLQQLSHTNTKIILQKPSIYDQTAKLSSSNHFGVNDALGQCAEIVEELAKKYNARVVDYWGFMSKVNRQLQQKDSTATIISIDRVHPWGTGDLIMAYQFLKETGAPQTVATVRIEKKKVKECTNCEATILKADKKHIVFTLKEKSLPFPVEDERQTALALELVPFIKELNQETLQVKNLKQGNYTLTIDGVLLDTLSHKGLGQGVNLALYRNTPQYQQALAVKKIAADYRALQRKLRDIKLVQNRHLPIKVRHADLSVIKPYIAGSLDSLKTVNERKYQEAKKYYGEYLILKPQEQAMEEMLTELTNRMYTQSKPVEHRYKIEMLPHKKAF